MDDKRKSVQVPLMLTVPREIRDHLRVMAAKQNLQNPGKVTSAAQIGREIICQYLAEREEGETHVDE